MPHLFLMRLSDGIDQRWMLRTGSDMRSRRAMPRSGEFAG